MSYHYLASPYSDPNPELQAYRYSEACRASAWLMKRGFLVFSTIAHNHPIAMRFGLRSDAAFWWEYNQTMIRYSGGVIVLQIGGWRDSIGVEKEIKLANTLGIKVTGLQLLVGGEFKLT